MEGNREIKAKVLQRVKNQGLRQPTIDLYDKMTNWLIKFSGSKPIDKLDSSDIDAFLGSLRTRKFTHDKTPNLRGKKGEISNTTLNTYQHILRKTMKIVHDSSKGKLPKCVEHLEKIKVDKREPQPSELITAEEIVTQTEMSETTGLVTLNPLDLSYISVMVSMVTLIVVIFIYKDSRKKRSPWGY